MEKLNEQQLRALAELPYGKKYASIRVAAEEEMCQKNGEILMGIVVNTK